MASVGWVIDNLEASADVTPLCNIASSIESRRISNVGSSMRKKIMCKEFATIYPFRSENMTLKLLKVRYCAPRLKERNKFIATSCAFVVIAAQCQGANVNKSRSPLRFLRSPVFLP
jgi:hypothetical protein